jgi:hypothetical protein
MMLLLCPCQELATAHASVDGRDPHCHSMRTVRCYAWKLPSAWKVESNELKRSDQRRKPASTDYFFKKKKKNSK